MPECVCVTEREKDRQTDRERERESEKGKRQSLSKYTLELRNDSYVNVLYLLDTYTFGSTNFNNALTNIVRTSEMIYTV